jgi:hypothetical protein
MLVTSRELLSSSSATLIGISSTASPRAWDVGFSPTKCRVRT